MDKITAADLTLFGSFYEPFEDTDADGQVIQDWLLRFTCPVHVRHLRGGEEVMQARLQSKNPVIVTVRTCNQARAVTSEWRVSVGGKLYDIKEDPRPDQARRLLEMLAEG